MSDYISSLPGEIGYTLVGGAVILFLGFLYKKTNLALQQYKLSNDLKISQPKPKIITKKSKYQDYLDHLFPELTDDANGVVDENERERIHERLKSAALDRHDRDDKGWEILSRDIVEKKMFGTVWIQ